MNATLKKFMFETTFDDLPEPEPVAPEPEETEEEKEPEIIVPTFSEAELEAARLEGFTTGKQEGQQETSVSVEARIAESLAVIEAKCQDLFQIQQDDANELSRAAITVAREVTQKVVPTMIEASALDEVERVIQSVFDKIVEEPRVIVNVHPDLADDLRVRIENMSKTKTYEGNIHVQPNEAVSLGDCAMEWASGGTERNVEALWQDIDEIIDRYLEGKPTVWNRPDAPTSELPVVEAETDADVETADPEPEINPKTDD